MWTLGARAFARRDRDDAAAKCSWLIAPPCKASEMRFWRDCALADTHVGPREFNHPHCKVADTDYSHLGGRHLQPALHRRPRQAAL